MSTLSKVDIIFGWMISALVFYNVFTVSTIIIIIIIIIIFCIY